MGLVIRLHDITGFSTNYKVEFKTGATPNSGTVWSTGSFVSGSNKTTLLITDEIYTGSLNESSLDTGSLFLLNAFNPIDYPNQRNPVIVPNQYNNLKFWVRITDNVTGNYVIENINIHEKEYYSDCMYCCEFDYDATSIYVSGF
jgi:hypothetical protein